jgi:hypothetical protein
MTLEKALLATPKTVVDGANQLFPSPLSDDGGIYRYKVVNNPHKTQHVCEVTLVGGLNVKSQVTSTHCTCDYFKFKLARIPEDKRSLCAHQVAGLRGSFIKAKMGI